MNENTDRSADAGVGGYDVAYRATPSLWGTTPGSLLSAWATIHSPSPGGAALDAGCGEGKNARFLHRLGLSVDAFDISGPALDNAERAGIAEPGINVWRADARTVSLQSDRYDVVVAYGLYHCFSDDAELAAVVKTLQDCTRSGGFNVVCALNVRRDGFTTGHEGFSPTLRSHRSYIALYDGWDVSSVSDRDLTESHPPLGVKHTHAVTRFLAKKP